MHYRIEGTNKRVTSETLESVLVCMDSYAVGYKRMAKMKGLSHIRRDAVGNLIAEFRERIANALARKNAKERGGEND